MKNSTWFEVKNGQSIESYLKEINGEFPKKETCDCGAIIYNMHLEEWDCRWCCLKNAVGLDVCERCGMPR